MNKNFNIVSNAFRFRGASVSLDEPIYKHFALKKMLRGQMSTSFKKHRQTEVLKNLPSVKPTHQKVEYIKNHPISYHKPVYEAGHHLFGLKSNIESITSITPIMEEEINDICPQQQSKERAYSG